MITVLVSSAPDRATLEKEFRSYCSIHRIKPTLIVAHKNMAFEFPEQNDSTETTLYGVRILDLDEFYDLHDHLLDEDV